MKIDVKEEGKMLKNYLGIANDKWTGGINLNTVQLNEYMKEELDTNDQQSTKLVFQQVYKLRKNLFR